MIYDDPDIACRVGAFAADGGDGVAERVCGTRADRLRFTKEFAEVNTIIRRDS